jgi:hypothetical protein
VWLREDVRLSGWAGGRPRSDSDLAREMQVRDTVRMMVLVCSTKSSGMRQQWE